MIGKLAMVLVAMMTALQPAALEKQPIVERSNLEMCEQVAHELNDWYTSGDGSITKEQAHRIIDRCFRMFVDAK